MRRSKHPLRVSHSEFQKLQGNITEPTHGKALPKNKRCKKEKDGSNNKCLIFITFYISDNRERDLDGMVSTVFDCLVRSKRISEDKRQIIPMFIVDMELCKKGNEGFRVRIVTI